MNIYTKLIKKIENNETATVIANVFEELYENNPDDLEDGGFFDFSEAPFKEWLRKKHPEITKGKRFKTDGEELFFSLSTDNSFLYKLYAEYAIDNELVQNIIDILSEFEYGYEEYDYQDENEDEDDWY